MNRLTKYTKEFTTLRNKRSEYLPSQMRTIDRHSAWGMEYLAVLQHYT